MAGCAPRRANSMENWFDQPSGRYNPARMAFIHSNQNKSGTVLFCRAARFALVIAAVLYLTLLGGCMPAKTPTPDQSQLRFLALGDSYTIGEGLPVEDRWPVQLVGQLRAAGLSMGEPEIIARTGWTTDELAAALVQAGPQGPYDLVSLLVGVNNQYRGRDLAEYRDQFSQLLEKVVSLAGGDPERVLVLSIPDWGMTPFAEGLDTARIAAEIDSFNVVNREEAGRVGARYIDVTPASRLAATDPELIAPDGLHPSQKMYAAWVELALPEALAALDE